MRDDQCAALLVGILLAGQHNYGRQYDNIGKLIKQAQQDLLMKKAVQDADKIIKMVKGDSE